VVTEARANTWASSRRGRPAAWPGHPVPARAEQPLVRAQPGEHQHGREEADHRAEPGTLVAQVVERQRAGADDERGSRHRDDGLGPAARAQHRRREHEEQHSDGQCLAAATVH
jgi:hypothetical protein